MAPISVLCGSFAFQRGDGLSPVALRVGLLFKIFNDIVVIIYPNGQPHFYGF